MPWPVTLHGRTYSESDFTGSAYLAGLPDLMQDAASHFAEGYVGTSVTSLVVGTGTKVLTVQANKLYAPGQPVVIASTANPTTVYMDGRVSSYVAATGVLTVSVDVTLGSGTLSDWTVTIGGARISAALPLGTGSGGTGATTADQALTNLGVTSVAKTLIGQTTQALMRTAGLGFSALGDVLSVVADAAAGRAALGISTVGSTLLTQTTQALMRTTGLGLTTTGDALATASSVASARSALSLGDMATYSEASQADAESMTSSSAIMSPRRVGDSFDILVPVGTVLPYAGASVPNSNWLFPYGQAISRTTYANLFSLIGTTYGTGDGSTTFNLPDARGRVFAGQDDMGGVSANRLTGLSGGVNGDTLGASGGEEAHVLTIAEMPSHNHTISTAGNLSMTSGVAAANTGANSPNTGFTGGDSAHNNVQPTLILNYIMRVL